MALINVNPQVSGAAKTIGKGLLGNIINPNAVGSLGSPALSMQLAKAITAPKVTVPMGGSQPSYISSQNPSINSTSPAIRNNAATPDPFQLYKKIGAMGANQTVPPVGVKANAPGASVPPLTNTLAPKFTLTPSVQQNQAALGSTQQGAGTGNSSNMSNSPVTQDQLTLWNKIHPGVPFPGFIPQSNTQGGTQTQQSTNQSGQTGTQTQPQQQSQTSTQQNGNQQGGLYGALISALAQRSLQPSQDYQNQQNLANQYNQALTGSRLAEAGALAGNAATPVDQSFGEGRANIIGNRYAQEQAALGSGFQGASTLLGAANTQQGLQQSGLGSAAGLAQPVSQFGMLTNPITGVPLNTGVFQNAVQQAVQLVQNGTPANDPSVTSLLSSFGFVGPLAFQNAMSAMSGGQGSVWNPAAQSAAAGQNIAGATNFQQQAVALDTGLKNMRTVAPLITQAASQVGINPTDASMYNAPINTYISQIQNSGGFANFQAMINDVQRYSSQIISSGADLTPTGVTAATALMSPQNLSISQIQSYLGTLDQLGTNQLAILQQQAQASGGSSAGYYGNPANVTSGYTAPQSNALGGNITSPGGQFAAGAGLGVLGSFENIGSTVLSFLAGLKL